MKKTSRRSFGKQLGGAMAALPLASLAIETSAVGQTPSQKKRPSPFDFRSHQDTPPPILIEEGSIKVDVQEKNLGAGGILPPHPSGGYRWEYPTNIATTTEIFLVGIKVVSGEERLLFYLDRDFGKADRNPISVRIHTEGPDNARLELVLSTEGKYVTFRAPANRELKRLATPDPASPGRVRFRYHDQTGGTDYHIKTVAIAAGPVGNQTLISRIDARELPESAAELKVMLWFEDINA